MKACQHKHGAVFGCAECVRDVRERYPEFPLQVTRAKETRPGPTSVPWPVAERAWAAYSQRYGRDQSVERLAERGGFSWWEMDDLFPGWREATDQWKLLTIQRDAALARVKELEDEGRQTSSAVSLTQPSSRAREAEELELADASTGLARAVDRALESVGIKCEWGDGKVSDLCTTNPSCSRSGRCWVCGLRAALLHSNGECIISDAPRVIGVDEVREELRALLDATTPKDCCVEVADRFMARLYAKARPADGAPQPKREPTRDEMEAALGDAQEVFFDGAFDSDAGTQSGTVRRCLDCRAPVFGGPTRCTSCASAGPRPSSIPLSRTAEEAQAQDLADALKGLLKSADAAWELNGGGHDWKEACERARQVLQDYGWVATSTEDCRGEE